MRYYHTMQWTAGVLLGVVLVDLYFVITKANGKFAMVTLLFGCGWLCVGIYTWFTVTSEFVVALFSNSSEMFACLGMIFLGQVLQAFTGDAPAWKRSGVLSVAAIAAGAGWVIIDSFADETLTTDGRDFWTFAKVTTWACIYILIDLVLIVVIASLPHEMPERSKMLMKFGVLFNACSEVGYFMIALIYKVMVDGNGGSIVLSWVCFLVYAAGQACFLGTILFSAMEGGAGIEADQASAHLVRN